MEFQNSDILVLKSIIIGCTIVFEFNRNRNMMLLVETILALIESIVATSIGKIFPMVENICINVIVDNNIGYFSFLKDNKTNKVILGVNLNNIFTGEREMRDKSFLEFFAFILGSCFYTEDIKDYVDSIFRMESVHERIVFTFNHKRLFANIIGDNPKVFFDDWKNDKFFCKQRRLSPVNFHKDIGSITQNLNISKKSLENTPHNKFIIHSIIDDSLWDKAGWKATGVLVFPNILGLALIFKDFAIGKQIFANWEKSTGKIDTDELINILIVKGINKYNPSWYRAIITTNQKKVMTDKDKFHIFKSRINEMNADNSSNLDIFENTFRISRTFILFPSSADALLPEHLKFGIFKTRITIKNAWQIGINDPYQVAIRDTDVPILPEGIADIPVLSLLKQKRETQKGAPK
jgi:hypothetical protein